MCTVDSLHRHPEGRSYLHAYKKHTEHVGMWCDPNNWALKQRRHREGLTTGCALSISLRLIYAAVTAAALITS
jgi:hypothetical protein